jgi:hypothetical protein
MHFDCAELQQSVALSSRECLLKPFRQAPIQRNGSLTIFED